MRHGSRPAPDATISAVSRQCAGDNTLHDTLSTLHDTARKANQQGLPAHPESHGGWWHGRSRCLLAPAQFRASL